LFEFCNSGKVDWSRRSPLALGARRGPANEMSTIRVRRAAIVVGLLTTSVCVAQETVNLWPRVAPGSENWTQKEVTIQMSWGTVLQNVVTPTLTAYLPEKSRATGTGVIVAPGGSCIALAIKHEGADVATWLHERGIAAFVLKYRVQEHKGDGIPLGMNFDEACKYGIADGIQAMKVVRQHAADWGVSPDRIGFMGFSAGAMVTSGVLLQSDAATRPAFAAQIFGGPFGVMPTIPANLPPIFLAWAQDDDLVLEAVEKFYDALKAAGNKAELHIYSAGKHGFGMRKQGTSSDHWIDEFYWWLEAKGFAKRMAK
jgi:acetyl esterase/lipase